MKKFAVLVAFVLLFALAAVPAFGQGGIVYDTGFQVQNLGDAEANVVITYYGQDGSEFTQNLTIPANGSATVYPIAAVPDTFNGSAVISSDQPVAAIANELGNNGAFGASYGGFNAGATKISLPLIMCNNAGFDTWFNIQNAGSSDANVTITYYPGTNGVAGLQDSTSIKAGAAKTFNQKAGSAGVKNCDTLKDGSGKFVGSAVIESTNGVPVVAAVNQVGPTTLLAYNGFTAGSTEVGIPLVNINNVGYVTGIQVQNTGSAATDISVEFTCGIGGPIATQSRTGIAPNQAATFFMGAAYSRCVGGAKVTNTAGQPLVAIVNQLNSGANKGSSYNGVDPAGATGQLSMPLIMDRNAGYYTGFNVQNVGTSTANVSCTFSNASVAPVTASLAAGATLNHLQLNYFSGMTKYVGSATCTAAGGKIVGVVNELNSSSAGDAFFTYNAFNY